MAALRKRLASNKFDMLYVNAGVTTANHETAAKVSTGEFVRVMITNALSPIRVIETLCDVVVADGTIGIMSSGRGSVATTRTGRRTCIAAARRRSTCSCAVSPPATPRIHGPCC